MAVSSAAAAASRRSKLHTRSAKPSVSVCNLEAASGPGTLDRSSSSAEGPPERVRDALSSCRVRVTACCSQAALNRRAMSSAALRPKRAFYRAQGLVIRGLRPYSLWGHPQSARPGLLGQLQGRGKGAQVLPGNSRPPPASPQAVRAAGVWCGGPPGHPGAPLPTRAARRSGVKQVLQSSAASVTQRLKPPRSPGPPPSPSQ